MAYIFHAFAVFFDWITWPMVWMHPWVGMIGWSLITAVLALLVYKYTSNQKGIRRAKDLIKAHLIAMSLYRDSLRVLGKSSLAILGANLKYLSLNAVPLLFMIIPVSLLMANLDGWYGYRALGPGETALLEVQMDRDRVMADDVSLTVPPGLEVDTLPVRIPTEGEICWRLRAVSKGEHEVTIEVGDERVAKTVEVGSGAARLSTRRHAGGFIEGFLFPAETAFDTPASMHGIDLAYVPVEMEVAGFVLHWVYWYFILTIVFAFALRGVIGVTF